MAGYWGNDGGMAAFDYAPRVQQPQQQQQQPQSNTMQTAMDTYKKYQDLKGMMPSSGSATAGGGMGTGVGQGFESFAAGGSNGGALGLDMNGFMGAGTPAAEGSGGSWFSGMGEMFGGGGGGGASSAAGSNPYGWIVAAVLSANVMHNKEISPWHEGIKGQGGGNLADYYAEGGHGIGSKIAKPGTHQGETVKMITDMSELDFSNGFKHMKSGIKNMFKFS